MMKKDRQAIGDHHHKGKLKIKAMSKLNNKRPY